MADLSGKECFFCESKEVALPDVGIAMGMSGGDYSFCETCLRGMTAEEFWRKFFDKHGWAYPPDAALIVADAHEN